MADNKKYYYIKLKDNYFEQDNIKVLESMENGYIYSLIIIKLYVKSAKSQGRLMMTSTIPYNPQRVDILAKVLGHDIAHVKEAIKLGVELDLITIVESGDIWLTDIQNFIGKSSNEGDRKRIYRKNLDKKLLNGQMSEQMSEQMSDKRPPKKEKEIKKDIEIKKKKGPFESVFEKLEVSDNLKNTLIDFIAMRKNIKAPMTQRALELSINKLRKMSISESTQIEIVNQSIMNSWKGLFELKQSTSNPNAINTDFASNDKWDRIAREQEEKERLNGKCV